MFGLVCSLSECARDSEKVAKSIAFQSFAGEKDDARDDDDSARTGRDGMRIYSICSIVCRWSGDGQMDRPGD